MKEGDCSGSNNAVVAATTSSLSSSLSSSALLSVAAATAAAAQPPTSSSSTVEDCGPASWQRSVKDLHSSSDTDDCDLDLGIGRLVIDLEADPDTKSHFPSTSEMKSSSGQPKSSISISGTGGGNECSVTAVSIHNSAASSATNTLMDGNSHLSRNSKTTSIADAKNTTKSITKNIPLNSNLVPLSSTHNDPSDKGIKMRIKCSQTSTNSSSSGSTSKHEILQFHTPFLSSSSSSENTQTVSSGCSSTYISKTTSDRSFYGSSNVGKSNCGRSSHKKDRHSTKDRNKVSNASRTSVGEDAGSVATGSSPCTHSNCSSSSAGKDSADMKVKMDVSPSIDGLDSKVMTSLSDPYEFNMKTEDVVGLPVKKIKLEKCDAANSPIVDPPFLPEVEKKDVAVDASHIGTITEPECLGPCEPGTSVTLEGIVWNETENGLLVVNVTWRGKTYVGTLMDSTKHHWAPPRFSGDSPTSDFETRTPKGRGKRGRTCAVAQRNEGNGSDRKLRSNRFSKPTTTVAASSPVRNDANSLKRSRTETASSDGSRGSKCSRSDSRTSDQGNGGNGELPNGGMIECPEENCSKKYRNLNGLRYHQTRAHKLSCAALAKETHDVETSKYINDDFVETPGISVERAFSKSKNSSMESSGLKKSVMSKPTEVDAKVDETFEEMDLETKLAVDGIQIKEEAPQDVMVPEKASTDVQPKLEVVSGTVFDEELVEHTKNSLTIKGANLSVAFDTNDAKLLGDLHQQPLVSLTPVSITPIRFGDDANIFPNSSASVTNGNASAGLSDASLPSNVINLDDMTSQSSNDQSKFESDRKKSKSDKVDRSKMKPILSGSAPRPIVPASVASSPALMKPVLLAPQSSPSGASSQLKPIQPKPVMSSEQLNANQNLTALAEKPKKRKREKEKQKEQLFPSSSRPVSVNKAENIESGQQLSQNTAVLSIASSEPASGQVLSSQSIPVAVTTTSNSNDKNFSQLLSPVTTNDQGHSVFKPEMMPASARCGTELDVLPQFMLHPTSTEQPVQPQTAPSTPGDGPSISSSSIHPTLPPPSPSSQQRLLLTVDNLNMRSGVNLKSPLSALKAVPSSVIKNTSSFETGPNPDLPVEPKSFPAADGDLPGQPLVAERKLLILPVNNDFTGKPAESAAKSAQDSLHTVASSNLTSTSPCRKPKNTSVKHSEGSGSLADFGDPHSPAYSDISDANDNAPLLDAPMLEKEAQAAAEEEVAGSKVSPSHAQDSYVYSPFYGQPPYLTPAVPSADLTDCVSVLKPPMGKPLTEKHLVMEKGKMESGSEKRLTVDSVGMRSRPQEMPLKFAGEQRDEKEGREKGGKMPSSIQPSGFVRSDVHKTQNPQQQQQHKMFSGETMLPQQAAMMPHMIMPPSYGYGGPYGYFNAAEYSEQMQRLYQQQLQQQQEARRHDQASISKSQPPPDSVDHGRNRQPGKVPVDNKHSDDKFKLSKYEGALPTPPSLIPDRSRHDLKEEMEKVERNREREKSTENRKKDGVEMKNIAEMGGGMKQEGGYDMKTLAERPDIPRYCLQPHFLEQQQQRLSEHQSHKTMMESGGSGGCKPSAVVAPQARDKNVAIGGIVGTTPMLHGSKQPREDSQGRVHSEGHRSHRDSQKNPPATPPQQHTMQHKSAPGSSRDGSTGRVPKDAGERLSVKDEPGQTAGSRGVVSKGKEDVAMTSLPISMPTGIPAPYASYYGHYLPAAAYAGAMPFDPSHATLYPGMIGYPPPPYLHAAQMLSPALAIASADGKPCDILSQPQPPASFFSNEGQPHKIHELKEVAKMQQGDRSQPSPGNREAGRPKSRSSGSHSLGKDSDHSSPPTQRHLHTHHHMHVVGALGSLYPYVTSDAAIIASQQATAAAQIPRPFLAK